MESTWQDKAAGVIGRAGLAMQKKFAFLMNKLVGNLSSRTLKIWLIVFCTCGGLASLYSIAQSFTNNKPDKVFTVEQSSVPKHFNRTGDAAITHDVIVDEKVFQAIQLFKRYVDSLRVGHDTAYTQLLTERPGLLDSIVLLERIYYSQKIK